MDFHQLPFYVSFSVKEKKKANRTMYGLSLVESTGVVSTTGVDYVLFKAFAVTVKCFSMLYQKVSFDLPGDIFQ